MSRWQSIFLFLIITLPSLADDSVPRAYSVSFKRGATRITEQSFNVTLSPEQPSPFFKILDSNGKQRYVLRFIPDVPRGDSRILGWFVRLADLRHRIYDSVLPTSPDLARDTTQVWWFDARQFPKTQLQTTRIFKVEQFYLTLQVKDVKRLSVGQPYLKELIVAIEFTNTKPL